MHLNFTAKSTSYAEALGGDIIQLTFEEYESEDIYNPTALYLLISINYEFPPFTPSVEWFDGNEENGGAEILNYKIINNSLQLWLNNNLSFDISFSVNEETFKNIEEFLLSATKK